MFDLHLVLTEVGLSLTNGSGGTKNEIPKHDMENDGSNY